MLLLMISTAFAGHVLPWVTVRVTHCTTQKTACTHSVSLQSRSSPVQHRSDNLADGHLVLGTIGWHLSQQLLC